jgi:hypothetical protein
MEKQGGRGMPKDPPHGKHINNTERQARDREIAVESNEREKKDCERDFDWSQFESEPLKSVDLTELRKQRTRKK